MGPIYKINMNSKLLMVVRSLLIWKKNEVCVNPYHYERVQAPALPAILVPRHDNLSTNIPLYDDHTNSVPENTIFSAGLDDQFPLTGRPMVENLFVCYCVSMNIVSFYVCVYAFLLISVPCGRITPCKNLLQNKSFYHCDGILALFAKFRRVSIFFHSLEDSSIFWYLRIGTA